MQRREPMVARADRYAPVVFEVIEERLHQRHVDVLEAEAFRRDPALIAAEPEEQREGVAVGSDRVPAQVALAARWCVRKPVRWTEKSVGFMGASSAV